jgi:DNA-binding transcriptional regulator YiaG
MGKRQKFTQAFSDTWRKLTGRTPQVLARDSGAKVGEIKKASGVSNKDIAARMGVSERTVRAWETGKREPRGKTAARLNEVMTDALAKRQEVRQDRSSKRTGVPAPKPPTQGEVRINGAVKVGNDRTRPRTTHTIRSGDGLVTDRDIARLLAAKESGVPGLVEAEAGRLLALAWGIPADSTDYEVEFQGDIDIW